MSVINKMLRDLDSRQTAAADTAQAPGLRPNRTGGGTRVLHQDGHDRRWLGWSWFGVLLAVTLMVCAGALASWWYLKPGTAGAPAPEAARLAPALVPPPVAALATPVASATAAPAATAVETSSVMPAMPVLAVNAVAAPVQPESLTPVMSAAKPAPVTAAPSTPTPRPAPLQAALAMPAALATPAVPARPATAPASLSSAGPGGAAAMLSDPVRQSPALGALAQAQRLWSAGSQQAAIDLLQQALASAERAELGGTATANDGVLVLLARELARMELAQGRVSQALQTLTRLEPILSGSAEVWALRGSAAQRLGRHAESVAAYLSALKLRPDEPRWMLGAAVSLAAQGQTGAAGELAEKARAAGMLSPDVATYLRQLGVSVNAP